MKKLITRNFGAKVLSLVLAVLLWIFINGISDPVKTVTIKDIPVGILHESAVETDNKRFEIKAGQTVSVKVRGKSTIVDNLDADDFTATADFRNMSITQAVPIDINCALYGENDIEIMDRAPVNMLIELEDLATKSCRVSVVEDGVAADGYYIVECSASPNIITVSGTKTAVGSIDRIVVSADVSGMKDSFNIAAVPVAYDSKGNVVDSSKLEWGVEEIIVSVNMLPVKEVKVNVATSGEPNYLHTCTDIKYDPDTIRIAGKESDLEKLESIDLTVDISGATGDVEASINIEEYLEEMYGTKYIIAEDKNEMTVVARANIEEKEVKEIAIPVSKIGTKGLTEGLKATFLKEAVMIKVYSDTENLKTVTVDTLRPFIDLASYKLVGTYRVFLSINCDMDLVMSPTVTEVLIEEIVTDEVPGGQKENIPGTANEA